MPDRLQGVDVIAFLVDVHGVRVVICNEKKIILKTKVQNKPETRAQQKPWVLSIAKFE